MINDINIHVQNHSKVISLQYGVGEIVGNFIMYDGIDDYLEIKFSENDEVKYYCIKHASDVRLISSKKSVMKALKSMRESLIGSKLSKNGDEQKVEFLHKNVSVITKRIVSLLNRENLSRNDQKLLESTVKSLNSEVQEVYNLKEIRAQELIDKYLKCALEKNNLSLDIFFE